MLISYGHWFLFVWRYLQTVTWVTHGQRHLQAKKKNVKKNLKNILKSGALGLNVSREMA